MKRVPKVHVIGAGVIGLTTATLLLIEGYDVTILAKHFPGDMSIDYTSPWAGARWKTLAPNDDARLQRMWRTPRLMMMMCDMKLIFFALQGMMLIRSKSFGSWQNAVQMKLASW